MLTTGFKYYFGLGMLALVGAFMFGWTSGGADFSQFPGNLGQFLLTEVMGALTLGYRGGVGNHVGYVILIGLAIASFAMAGVTVAFRDADSKSLAELVGTDKAPRAAIPSSPNWWAPLGAFGMALLILAIVLGSWIVAALGIVVLSLVAFEWTMSAWSDRATNDLAASRALRDQIMGPLEFPIFGLIIIAFLVVAFSRVLLTLSRIGSSLAAIIAASTILLIATAISFRPVITKSIAVGVLTFGALVFLAGGVLAAVNGEREIEPHHAEDEVHAEEEGLGAGQDLRLDQTAPAVVPG